MNGQRVGPRALSIGAVLSWIAFVVFPFDAD